MFQIFSKVFLTCRSFGEGRKPREREENMQMPHRKASITEPTTPTKLLFIAKESNNKQFCILAEYSLAACNIMIQHHFDKTCTSWFSMSLKTTLQTNNFDYFLA